MPKSGFDPQRRQRRTQRHNPLGSASQSNPTPSRLSPNKSAALEALQQASKDIEESSAALGKDIVPLIARLPADEAAASSSQANLADQAWSLASVSMLLTVNENQTPADVKHNRKLLLLHNLTGRLVYALKSHTEVELRKEASGALRNLCVDAGIDVRNEVVNKGGVDAMLSAMRWASNALGFDKAASLPLPSQSFVDQNPTPEQDFESKRALLAKSVDKMNKKEKRHATKLAALLGKELEAVAGQPLSAQDQEKLSQHIPSGSTSNSSATSSKNEPFLTLDNNTRKGLLEMCENLATIAWCLCESGERSFDKLISWKWLDADIVGLTAAQNELEGEGLASWLCSALSLGSRAATILSTASADGSRSNSSAKSDSLAALANDELSLLLDLALASGNALCGLTEGGEAEFMDGFLGRFTPKRPKKGPKVSQVAATPIAQAMSEQPLAATRRLAYVHSAVSLLQACVQTPQDGIEKLQRYVLSQTTMLGVLATGILRNVAAAVDDRASRAAKSRIKVALVTSSNIFVPVSDGEAGSALRFYEESVVLPTLTKLLANVDMSALAHKLDGKGDTFADELQESSKDLDESVLRTRAQTKASEKAQTLLLALEILVEMAASIDGQKGDSGNDREWLEDPDAEDAEDDIDMEQDMEAVLGADDDEDDSESTDAPMNDTFADAVKRGGSIPFDAIAPVLSRLFAGGEERSLTANLLSLARPFEASFPSLSTASAESTNQSSDLLRGLHLRSLSMLNNLLLRLSMFCPPPPSQPASDPKEQRKIVAFREWTAGPAGKQLAIIYQSLFEIARGCASVPAVAANAGESKTQGQDLSDQAATSVMSSKATSVGADEASDGLQMVETCIGTMWSISRCLEGSVQLGCNEDGATISVAQPEAVHAEVIQALTAGYNTAATDGMRAKCLGLLAVIGRSPSVHPDLNHFVGSFLIERLEAIPEGSSNAAMRGPTSPETLVAVVNGLIDMYADEMSSYDHVFRTQDFLPRIRLTLFRCKTLARTIDRRKQISLRASAEEAIENLQGFIQYRQSLALA